MRLNTRTLILPALFVMRGVLAQQSAVATSGSPDVTYPDGDAFIFCSSQDCTGTCVVVNAAGQPAKVGQGAPGFLSVYWYDPDSYAWVVYACTNYSTCDGAVGIGPNTCYNMYDNGVPTDFYEYYHLVDSVP